MFAVGVWYLATGLFCLAEAGGARTLSPWLMGIPFGVGQLMVAAVLQFGYGESLE
jgi:membrane protein implicated in regulation of membrane protease activity